MRATRRLLAGGLVAGTLLVAGQHRRAVRVRLRRHVGRSSPASPGTAAPPTTWPGAWPQRASRGSVSNTTTKTTPTASRSNAPSRPEMLHRPKAAGCAPTASIIRLWKANATATFTQKSLNPAGLIYESAKDEVSRRIDGAGGAASTKRRVGTARADS